MHDRRAADARLTYARDRHGGAERSAIATRASAGGSVGRRPPSSYERLAPILSAEHTVDFEIKSGEALFSRAEGNYDLLIVSLSLENYDGLRLCSQWRSLSVPASLRSSPSPMPDNNARLLRGSKSASTIICCVPSTRTNCCAAARTQIRKRRYTDHLRDNVQNSIEMAILAALDRLHTAATWKPIWRRWPSRPRAAQAARADDPRTSTSSKSITTPMATTPATTCCAEFAVRIRKSIRGIDLACRLWRRGIRDRDAETDLTVPAWSRAPAPLDRRRNFAVTRAPSGSTSRFQSAWRRLDTRASRSPTCSSAPTWRCIGQHDGRNRVVSTAA